MADIAVADCSNVMPHWDSGVSSSPTAARSRTHDLLIHAININH